MVNMILQGIIMIMLKASQLSKMYNRHAALQNLNLTVNPGEIYCLLGANGAGKSTTINLFLGFIRPSSGKVYVNDIDVNENLSGIKQYIAYIPENLMLYPYLSGLENLEFFCKLANKRYSKVELLDLLIRCGLQENYLRERVAVYSKGMRQKVGIAMAIAKEAKALLLDEPTSGLDPKASNEFSELLLNMKTKGLAVLMATHDLFRAKETGTHIGIMKQGQLVESFACQELGFKDMESLYLKHMHN